MSHAITLLDGAYGTRLWSLAEEHGYAKDPTWTFNLSHPELVRQVAEEYLAAGSRILASNTFSANPSTVNALPGYDLAEVIRAAVRIGREVTDGTDARLALDIGPLPQMLEPYGELTEAEAADSFRAVLSAGIEAGAELVFFETFMDLSMLTIAVREAKKFPLPVFASMSFGKKGRTMMGDRVEEIARAMEALGADAVGLNCSLGPADAVPVLQAFAEATDLPLIFKPNAGLPITAEDGSVLMPYDAQRFAAEAAPALSLASYVGSCCGSDEGYIRALAAALTQR